MQNQAKTRLLRLAAMVLLAVMLLTACASKAAKAREKFELGQKYLTEMNYTEAVASFTEAIELNPDDIEAYLGRAEAYIGLKQYDDAKADYGTAIEKAADQPYLQAEAYIGRAEINEQTDENEDALSDYEAASTALDKVDVEKITDVTEQMLEALKIKVYNACARLSTLLGRYDAAVAGYTKALESLSKLPDDADVLDVKAAKVTSYTGRAEANTKLENYADVLPDYDALIDLGEDKTVDRDTLLAALSLAQSQAGDLAGADSWLGEVNHADYAESIQLTAAEDLLKNAAGLAKAEGTDAYEKIKAALTTDAAKAAMQNLLARGYQLRYYDAEGKMLAVYAGAAAWDDVNETENGTVTADDVATVAAPTAEDVNAVSLSKLYVYYGAAEGRSREGEGLWYILNPGKTDLTAETYTWKNDAPDGGFQKKEELKPVTYSNPRNWDEWNEDSGRRNVGSENTVVTYQIGGNTITVRYTYKNTSIDGENPTSAYTETMDDRYTYTLSQPLQAVVRADNDYVIFYVPAGTVVKSKDTENEDTDLGFPVIQGVCFFKTEGATTEAQQKAVCKQTDAYPHNADGSIDYDGYWSDTWWNGRIYDGNDGITVGAGQMYHAFGMIDGAGLGRLYGGVSFCAQ